MLRRSGASLDLSEIAPVHIFVVALGVRLPAEAADHLSDIIGEGADPLEWR